MTTAIVILSGGLDSTVLAAHMNRTGPTRAVSFDYGQRHGARELHAAAAVASHLGIAHEVIDIRSIGRAIAGHSALLGMQRVPHGHYADESMKATVVPNRNMIMLAVAAGVAIAHGAESVAYAAHAGDHAIYPDCRPEFADALGTAIALADWHTVKLARPFITMSKADIVEHGESIGAPMHLTWSCYEGGERHCGRCGTCVERIEAFDLAGVVDPTEYAAP